MFTTRNTAFPKNPLFPTHMYICLYYVLALSHTNPLPHSPFLPSFLLSDPLSQQQQTMNNRSEET